MSLPGRVNGGPVRQRNLKARNMTEDVIREWGELKPNDRVWLSGGYEDTRWLCGKTGYSGIVMTFIPGQNKEPAAVIRLDEKIDFEGASGDVLVLELRWTGSTWDDQGVVHVELCDFIPEHKTWKDRKQGKWVESHASYRKIKESA